MSENITNSSEFRSLARARRIVCFAGAGLILLLYFGFILLIAFKKEVLAEKIFGKLSLGIPAGIGLILSAWLLTGIYTYWANSSYDEKVKSIKSKYNL